MRFEIGPGGGLVILVGLLGLSAGVFFLGMISGREMAQSELGQSQLATAYPMPSAGAAPAAVAAATPAAPAPVPSARAAMASAPPVAKPRPAPVSAAAAERAAPPRRTVASAPPPRHAMPEQSAARAPTSRSGAAAEEAGMGNEGMSPSRQERASAPPPAQEHQRSYAAAHRHGYNIVIDAAMDRAGANRMVSRLLSLGYTPRIVPTRINGQTWYKVQVGPYASADDARAAQAQLRAAYTARYVNRTSAYGGGGARSADPAGSPAGPSD